VLPVVALVLLVVVVVSMRDKSVVQVWEKEFCCVPTSSVVLNLCRPHVGYIEVRRIIDYIYISTQLEKSLQQRLTHAAANYIVPHILDGKM
jgi:hypothetical protein